MVNCDSHLKALINARPPDAPGSLDLLNELVRRISAICTTVIVSIRYPNDDSNLKKCNVVEQYFSTVLAANLSNNLPACSAKLGDVCKSMYTVEESPSMLRSEQTSEPAWD